MGELTLEHRVKTKASERVTYEEAKKEFDAILEVIPTKDTIYWLLYNENGYKPEGSRKIFGKHERKTVPKDYYKSLKSLRSKLEALQLREDQSLADYVRTLSNELVNERGFRNKSSLSQFVFEEIKGDFPNLTAETVNNYLFHAKHKEITPWKYSAFELLTELKQGKLNPDKKHLDTEFFTYQRLLKQTLEYLQKRHRQPKEISYKVLSNALGLSQNSVISHLNRDSSLKTNTFFGVDGYYNNLMVYLLNQFHITVDLRDESRISEEAERIPKFNEMYPNRSKVIVLLNPEFPDSKIEMIKGYIRKMGMPNRFNISYVSDISTLEKEVVRLITPYTAPPASRSL